MPNQMRIFKHYHYDVYGVLEDLTTDEYLRRTMVDYPKWEGCLLAFGRGLGGTIERGRWMMDTRVKPVTFNKLAG